MVPQGRSLERQQSGTSRAPQSGTSRANRDTRNIHIRIAVEQSHLDRETWHNEQRATHRRPRGSMMCTTEKRDEFRRAQQSALTKANLKSRRHAGQHETQQQAGPAAPKAAAAQTAAATGGAEAAAPAAAKPKQQNPKGRCTATLETAKDSRTHWRPTVLPHNRCTYGRWSSNGLKVDKPTHKEHDGYAHCTRLKASAPAPRAGSIKCAESKGGSEGSLLSTVAIWAIFQLGKRIPHTSGC